MAASIIAVLKQGKSTLHICGDFSMTVNPVSEADKDEKAWLCTSYNGWCPSVIYVNEHTSMCIFISNIAYIHSITHILVIDGHCARSLESLCYLGMT